MAPICKWRFWGICIFQVGPHHKRKNIFIYPMGFRKGYFDIATPMDMYPNKYLPHEPLYFQHPPTTFGSLGIFSRLLRLGIHAILCGQSRFLATFALKCASWSAVNRGTSKRTPCTSVGYEEYESVNMSNTMASRLLEGKYTRFTVFVF